LGIDVGALGELVGCFEEQHFPVAKHKVGNLEEIDAGMQATDTERHGLEFVIEKYCDAPEVGNSSDASKNNTSPSQSTKLASTSGASQYFSITKEYTVSGTWKK
jgi:hypothetical protein